ncbi:MAG TPA: LPXTG cell wall anchor domain-containing protein [Acidobacteriota bacterium]|nr:LPXTG cell wall anchor domain-containing protein [Acidobacteriota bacterium]
MDKLKVLLVSLFLLAWADLAYCAVGPVLKKVMFAFYVVAGVAAAGLLIWYFVKKRES